MGTLRLSINDEKTTEPQPKRFLTLAMYGADGSIQFVGLDGTASASWSGRWVTMTRVPDEPTLWETIVTNVPAGEYFAQFRMVEDRSAVPVYRGPAYVPAETVNVEIRSVSLAMARGYAGDLPTR